jgi:hypothetical protein
MKISAPNGIIIVYGDQKEARDIRKGHTLGQNKVHLLDTSEENKEP